MDKTRMARTVLIGLQVVGLALGLGCSKSKSTEEETTTTTSPTPTPTPTPSTPSRYLYVSTGTCYSGAGNTTFSNTTATNTIFRINVNTGVKDATVADYNSSPAQAGDSPVSITDGEAGYIYALVENTTTTGARRIEKIEKKLQGARTTFSNNITALSGALKGMVRLSNGDFLVGKTTAIEKITSANVRLTSGANPFINAPAAPCATSTTLMSAISSLNNSFIAFAHAATAQNRFAFVKPTGYSAGGDCTPAQSAPNVGSFPVATAYDAANTRLFVAYAGNSAITAEINSIYVYNLTETASSVTVSASNKIYDASAYPATYPYLLYGISGMHYDVTASKLYVATAISTATTVVNYAIERFSYDSSKVGTANSTVLTRDGSTPFFPYGSDTKCVPSMFVGD